MNLSRFWSARRTLTLGTVGGVMLTLAACFPTSEHPIALSGEADVPDVFTGIWEGGLGDGQATLIFMEQASETRGTPRFHGLIIRHKEGMPSINEGWLEFEADAAQIRGEIFLSALLKRLDGKPAEIDERGYYLFRVQIDGDDMSITGLDDLVTIELINRGALEGTVSRSAGIPIVRLRGDGISLRAFLVTADLDEVFSEPFAEFTRQK